MSDNVALKMIDDAIADLEFEQPGCEPFRIDNDQKAEWHWRRLGRSKQRLCEL